MQKSKEVTIYDLARKLKISPATVSRGLQDHPAISKKTKKRISALADKIGYRSNHFARNLRNQKTDTIGVIVPKLNSHFMSSVIAGIEHEANKDGYTLIISHSAESFEKEAVSAKTLFNNRVDGVLASLANDTRTLDHFNPFFKKNVPVIFFDKVMEHPGCINIVIDNEKAAYEAVTHLIQQGCKRIVHITALPLQNVYKDRLQGYKQALTDHKLKFNEKDVIIGNLSMDAGAEAANAIMKMKTLPDGIFVANDNAAVGCMLALKAFGIKIPGDIAFAGFNNDPLAIVIEPKLTTINYSGYEVGEVAARHLINHLNGVFPINNTNSIILRSELIIRESSLKKK